MMTLAAWLARFLQYRVFLFVMGKCSGKILGDYVNVPFPHTLPLNCFNIREWFLPEELLLKWLPHGDFLALSFFLYLSDGILLKKSLSLSPGYLCVISKHLWILALFYGSYYSLWCSFTLSQIQAGFHVLSTGPLSFWVLPYFLTQEDIPHYLIFVLSQLSS